MPPVKDTIPLRYRHFDADFLLSRGILYISLTVLVVSGYALLLAGASLILGGAVPANDPLGIGLLVLLLSLFLTPLSRKLQTAIDQAFFRAGSQPQDPLRSFMQKSAQMMDLAEIAALIRQVISQTVLPTRFHLFIHSSLGDSYVATADEQGRPSSEIHFAVNGPLAQFLSRRKSSLLLKEVDSALDVLEKDGARIAILNAHLIVPLPGQERLVGWLAFGPQRSSEPYSSADLAFLEALADQAAVALKRAQVVADLKRRVQEMNILTRIAQGINITLAFDDLLELFYAQTSRLMPVRDFRISLLDSSGENLYHAFYLENDERLTDRENRPIPEERILESVIVKSGRAIAASDYELECRSQGLVPETRGLFAWMGVPLSAGADTIGAVSVASRNPTVVFGDEQLVLLQAIADLAAGAIVKARLLSETETSERQMRTLNEIARRITSTLDLDTLLQEIMQNAVDILECEAGSLLMVDESTGESVFEVAIGPVGRELVGQRVPAGAGLVGKAVSTGQAIIQNDVRRSRDWFDTDKSTGFSTEDLLVVPMKVNERVIGVLEVLNKKDRSPFNRKDQELLSAFAAQAIVALENARLYTLTDKALAARVEELSVMQQIDRDLNAGLEVDRAMRITLEWALRQSRTDAGLIGEVTAEGIRVMAKLSNRGDLPAWPDSLLDFDLPVFRESIERGTLSAKRISADEDFRLLRDARARIIVPVRRETRTIALLYLESVSDEDFPDDVLAYLSRLSDHAAIAISNAQLYAAVQYASLAKSQFVSSAAHELKNPLTSIKGYSDLLVAGAVGPISDSQAHFLATIRSNAERMATLVSDLQDLSRIEAGQLRLKFTAIDLSEVIEEVKRSLQKQIEDKGQTLAFNASEELPLVWADHVRLAQIMMNLLSNAFKYTPQGGRITVHAGPSSDQAQDAPQLIHVSVQDTGIGIAPDDQRKIFQQFFRSEDPLVREVTGTGLGLSITRNLVEMQGGTIWFESRIGKGTTFHFTIPAVQDQS